MERTIKFRGKTVGGEWVTGNYAHIKKDFSTVKKGHYISNSVGSPFAFLVRPETVRQFTGLTDKNGNDIYEGDVYQDKTGRNYTIVFWGCSFCKFNGASYFSLSASEIKVWQGEIIGNIHDNPELLK